MARKPPRARGARTPGRRTDVGYGRPPVEHQFKPGQSGNKRGRPKGSKSEATIINEILSRKIKITQNGKTRQISLFEGMYLKFAEDALRGNPKAAAFLLARKQLLESFEQPATATLDTDGRTVWDSFIKDLEEKFKKEETTHE
jgi:hypothetical protein